jgi:glucosamine-6-phosphate deaminase
MKISTYKNYDEMCREAADLIIEQVNKKPDSLLCFPSGESPAGVYRSLANSVKDGRVDFSNCFFVGLDEWVGMGKEDEGGCTNFLYETFFTPLQIQPDKVMFFDARAKDLDDACIKMDNYIKNKGAIDIMMVGIGMNGHIGLNEPGTSFGLYSHHSPLAPVTIDVAQKYFKQQPRLKEGITLGLKHLSESKMPLLIAAGEKKAGIIKEALKGPITELLPSSIFQQLQHAFILLDTGAASGLND